MNETPPRTAAKASHDEFGMIPPAPDPNESDAAVLRTEELLLNMGPQHPSTHGVLRIVLDLEGERILKATPHLGYLHRGTEKLAEGKTSQQIVTLTERLDYVCAMTNNFAYVRAVEKLLGVTVPPCAASVCTV